jgi:hypothetical protein
MIHTQRLISGHLLDPPVKIEVRGLNILETVLQTAPRYPTRTVGIGGSFIFGVITAASMLLITVGIFYVLIKLGQFLDAMKDKTEAGSAKKSA